MVHYVHALPRAGYVQLAVTQEFSLPINVTHRELTGVDSGAELVM